MGPSHIFSHPFWSLPVGRLREIPLYMTSVSVRAPAQKQIPRAWAEACRPQVEVRKDGGEGDRCESSCCLGPSPEPLLKAVHLISPGQCAFLLTLSLRLGTLTTSSQRHLYYLCLCYKTAMTCFHPPLSWGDPPCSPPRPEAHKKRIPGLSLSLAKLTRVRAIKCLSALLGLGMSERGYLVHWESSHSHFTFLSFL